MVRHRKAVLLMSRGMVALAALALTAATPVRAGAAVALLLAVPTASTPL
jgi:hypothetical protein